MSLCQFLDLVVARSFKFLREHALEFRTISFAATDDDTTTTTTTTIMTMMTMSTTTPPPLPLANRPLRSAPLRSASFRSARPLPPLFSHADPARLPRRMRARPRDRASPTSSAFATPTEVTWPGLAFRCTFFHSPYSIYMCFFGNFIFAIYSVL